MNDPILTLNTAMHTASIRRVSSDAEGKFILTSSFDKTAKLWDAQTGTLINTLRPPMGRGNEGMIYACDLSPDGQYAALGGWSASYAQDQTQDIFIFNPHSGQLLHRLNLGNSGVIFHLSYSPDGQFLAAAREDGIGLVIVKTQPYEIVQQDNSLQGNCHGLAFSPQGTLAVVSYDSNIRLYGREKGLFSSILNANPFSLLKMSKVVGGNRPFSVAFSPNGSKLAVAFDDSPTISVLDGNSLSLLYQPDVSEADTRERRLFSVSFTYDGTCLMAGGVYNKYSDAWWQQVRVWEREGKGKYRDFAASGNTIQHVQPTPNGNILFSSADPDWGILDLETGKKLVFHSAETINYASTDESNLRVNHDATEIGFTPLNASALSFRLGSRTLTEEESSHPHYQDNTAGIYITDWDLSTSPKLNGKALLLLENFERALAVDISASRSQFVLGADHHIYCSDNEGHLIWKMATQASSWAVKIAGYGKVVVGTFGDGTIRWYRMEDGKRLLTFFLHADRKRWILWTPSGYYDASAGAEELIGWHVNQGLDNEALYYPISRFRSSFYRPDVIDLILNTLDEEAAVRLANQESSKSRHLPAPNILNELPPAIQITYPANGVTLDQTSLDLSYFIHSPNEEDITRLIVQVNGRPVSTQRGNIARNTDLQTTVEIPPENCVVSLIAENRHGSSEAVSIDVAWSGSLSISYELQKPKLYILAVGVSEYEQSAYNLAYADKDAEAFMEVLQKQQGLLYSRVIPKIFTNRQATKDNILDGLDWLIKETTQNDVAMIFFAGHGRENNRGTFYYLPYGADADNMRRTCIMREEIKDTVATISGKILVFMDACHSGYLMDNNSRRSLPDMTRIINELISAENGAVVFSSSTGRQFSLENPVWGHGAFTKALVEGLAGEAAYKENAKVTCKSLDLYITYRVKQLTKGKQSPTTNFPPNVEDFPIAIMAT